MFDLCSILNLTARIGLKKVNSPKSKLNSITWNTSSNEVGLGKCKLQSHTLISEVLTSPREI